jgi:hypothetical protein
MAKKVSDLERKSQKAKRRDVGVATRFPDPISVERALSKRSGTIRVPDGKEMIVGPFNQNSEDFRLAVVTKFTDFHKLGFIPKKVTEDAAVAALQADDRSYRQALRRMEESHGMVKASCSCKPRDYSASPLLKRRYYVDRFIEVLQPLYREPLHADDPAVVHPFRHVARWLERPNRYFIGLFCLEDINIGKKSTLTMTPTVKAVYANNINIAADGRFRFTSGFVHVRCNELNGPGILKTSIADVRRYLPGFSREVGFED